jgi:hypothetical protein
MIEEVELAFNCYIGTVISLTGIVLLAISLIIFYNKEFKENFYNYIRMEVLFSLLTLIFYTLRAVYYCQNPQTYGKYINCNIHLMSTYFRSVFDLIAILFTIISSIECFNGIRSPSRSKLLSKISYKLVTIVVIFICLSLFAYRLFEYDIKPLILKNNQTLYFLRKSNFTKSTFYGLNKIISFTFSNGITVCILVLLNCLIYIKIRNVIKNKINIIQLSAKTINDNNYSNNDTSLQSQNSTNKNNTLKQIKINNQVKLLVYGGSLNAIIARVPLLILLINEFAFTNYTNDFNNIVVLIGLAFLLLSYSIKFLLFYLANNLFRSLFNHYVLKLYNFVIKVR